MKNKLLKLLSFYSMHQRHQSIEKLLCKRNLVITILGYGVTGKSFLLWGQNNLHQSTRYFIIDKKYFEIVQSNDKKIVYLPEWYKKKCFKKSHYVFPSPGFLIKKKEKYYWKIIPELDLFFYIWNKLDYESIIITGSIGKTSLSTMIYHYLSQIKSAILSGNIGYPVLNFLNKEAKNNKKVAVIECSNLQLEHCVLIKVDYFIITNLFENHLNMHKNYAAYIFAKLSPLIYESEYIKQIIISQSAYNQILLFFPFLLEKINRKRRCIQEVKDRNNCIRDEDIIFLENNKIMKNNTLLLSQIPLFSFILNWQIAVALLSYYIKDVNNFIVNNTLPELPPFRLQRITTNNDSLIVYNDSKSTIIESSLTALTQILITHKNDYIIFIIGGLSKGVDRKSGINRIIKQVDQLILFGSEALLLYKSLLMLDEKNNFIESFEKLSEAISYSIELVKRIEKKTVIVFSPGGSSFDEFDSYIERGNYFNTLMNQLL